MRRLTRWLSVTLVTVGVVAVVAGGLGPTFAQTRLEAAVVAETVAGVAAVIEREYFDAGTATRVADLLRSKQGHGDYEGVETEAELAASLTHDLLAATSDKHLAVMAVTPRVATSSPRGDDSREAYGRRSNFGVERVEVLPGNVGYLEIRSFMRLEEASDAIDAAMRLLRNADALIIDLRSNGGGSPETVALLASYLVDEPGLPLFDVVPRTGEPHRYTAMTPLPIPHNGTRPLFLLTARGTFSAGEGFAFLLQERHRGEVVGETTAGAANPGRPYPIGDRFEVVVPNGHVRTAVSGRNWEGSGVVPDVAAPAADALRVAHVRALRRLVEGTPTGTWRTTLLEEIRRLAPHDR